MLYLVEYELKGGLHNEKGIAASKGYAIGTVFIQEHEEIIISDAKVSDIAAEKEKLSKALAQSKEQLEAIKEKQLMKLENMKLKFLKLI